MRSNIHSARQAVAALHAELLTLSASPEVLEAHAPALEAAVRQLETLTFEPQHAQRSEVEALANDLQAVAALIEHGMQFQQGWARMLAAMALNYQPNGEPSPLQTSGTVSIKG